MENETSKSWFINEDIHILLQSLVVSLKTLKYTLEFLVGLPG